MIILYSVVKYVVQELYTIMFINPRRACAARVTVVGSVCVCAPNIVYSSHKPSTNDRTYLTGNEGQKFCGIFSENAPLRASSIVRLLLVGHFTPRKPRMRIIFDHVVEAAILFPFR